jgi:hypothetical protein
VRKPWESEDAAFSFLLRVLAVCIVAALLSLALKAIF